MKISQHYQDTSIQNATYVGYYHILGISFCFIFILSNIAASKIGIIFNIFLDTGTAYFPLLYIINDITTEVYGFRASRKVIWTAVFANIAFVLLLSLCVKLPSSDSYSMNTSFNILFALSPRILIASVTSFLIGEYINSVILAVSKVRFSGRLFAFRAIASTFVGVTIESSLFAFIAFYGVVNIEELIHMTIMLVLSKVLYEAISIPLTSRIVKFLKKKENMDYYDKDTNFSLFSM